MSIEHIINPKTGKTWCGRRGNNKLGTVRKCRHCTHQIALAERAEPKKNDVLAKCPRCGKLIALIFPIHDCRPAVNRRNNFARH